MNPATPEHESYGGFPKSGTLATLGIKRNQRHKDYGGPHEGIAETFVFSKTWVLGNI